MKNIKFLLFIICLVFFLNVIFFNCSFATLYIIKDQEGNNICMINKEDLVSEYEKLGYAIWILKAGGLRQKSLEPNIFSNESQSQLKTESIGLEPQTKAVLPSTTELIPAAKTNVERQKMIEIFKANALTWWGNNSEMVNDEVKLQTEAYDWIVKQTNYTDIMARVRKKWGNNYAMVKYEYEQQVEAYEWISQQKAYPEIMLQVIKEWTYDYPKVKYKYEQQVEAYDWLQKNKNRNPEAYKRASDQWGNDYVTVKYEYEKEI
ncbi:MAG TPA: hypothetical protein VFC91_06415 [Atribacterota bacterium]|nr:hypothetical protein [Atribacterota bacterium]